jgi:uncharacterized spore protein YtfJ
MNDMEISEKFEDHEERIRTMEKNQAIIGTKLDITNKILAAIAVMMGSYIVNFIFSTITKK